MADLKPFQALRYNENKAGKTENVICPPYDIIPDDELKSYMDKSPYNVIHLERPIGDKPYDSAAETLKAYKDKGALCYDDKACMYIYEEEFEVEGETKAIKGIISGVKLEEFSKKIILPHEETLSKAKADRLNLMKKTFCNFSLIYSLFMDEKKEVEDIIEKCSEKKPDVEAKDEQNVIHRLWLVKDEKEIKKIQTAFKDKKLFIADGHHRYETALNFRNWCRENKLAKEGDGVDFIMMMLVDIRNKGLVVFPTHRIVKNVNNFSKDKILEVAEKYFTLESGLGTEKILQSLKESYGKGEKAFTLYLGNDEFAKMTLKDFDAAKKRMNGILDSVSDLDVTLLHTLLLEDALDIDTQNLANQTNLEYTRSFNEAIETVDNKKAQCAFILNPTRIEQIANVAESFGKMPQKSTYFYPKLTTGLVINDLTK